MKRNVQPFYTRAVVLFTATQDVSAEELKKLLRRALKARKVSKILVDTIDVEECDSEAGDPADLI